MRKRRLLATAVCAVAAMGLTACGGSGGGGDNASPEANAAIGKVFNPSDKKGGTLTFANSGEWDSLDPANTYYAYSWDFLNYYARTLVMFKPAPGKASQEIVGDLAQGPGVSSDGNKTWTYKLRPGLKFEDGSPITSKDVAYGVNRSYDKATLPNGPTYFNDLLNYPADYQGPYKSGPASPPSAIETPDPQTIVFHLKAPIATFDQFAQTPATAPVPQAKDTGAKYQEHVVSSGPYKFATNQLGKSFTLDRNPNWDPATDPNRKALPDKIDVALNVSSEDIDNRLISGDLQVDVTGTGLQSSALPRVLGDPTLKDRTDNPDSPRLWFTAVNPQVKPLDNVECRRAVLYAVDKVAYQNALGGEFAGGTIATTVIPPLVPGYAAADPYPSGPDKTGDLAKARESLAKCGQPNGFETSISYRTERPKEKAVAEALQQSLSRVGIKLNAKGFPQGGYFSQYAGLPPFARAQGLGLVVHGWQSDWNDPYAFLQQMVDSRTIRETGGGTNISVRLPQVDADLDKMVRTNDPAERIKLATQIDQTIMDQAEILPGVYAKTLLMRGTKTTNVFYNEQYGMYDYGSLGVSS